jgi:hypothetical protein
LSLSQARSREEDQSDFHDDGSGLRTLWQLGGVVRWKIGYQERNGETNGSKTEVESDLMLHLSPMVQLASSST